MANKERIFIFAPSVWGRLADTPHSFEQILTHEMNHVFYMNFVGAHTPQWLIEGIAMLVDGTGKNMRWKGMPKIEYCAFSLKERWRIQSGSNADASEFYRSSYLVTKKLVDRMGIEGLVRALRSYAKRPTKINSRKLFSAVA